VTSPELGGTGGPVAIEACTPESARRYAAALVDVLIDAVDGGASVGFLPPLPHGEAAAYWDTVADAVRAGSRVLLVARDRQGGVAGTAQLSLEARANGRHRAEVTKVMVHRRARGRGIGGALLAALEQHAARLGRTTLVLDTRQGDPSERLYARAGWILAGTIPRYAESADGRLDASAFYYKLLDSAALPGTHRRS
jgi:GNAT superfamily N-acetyltransferase